MLLFKLRKVQFCHQAAFVVHRESVAPKLESQRDSNINKVIYRLHKRALKCVCVCVTHLSVTRPCDELTVLLHEEQTKQWIRCETITSASSLHILYIYRL